MSLFLDEDNNTVPTDQKLLGQPTTMVGGKNDPSLSPSPPYGHGSGGLFNIPETNDGVFSAFISTLAGAVGSIPVIQTDPTGGPDVGEEFGGYDAEFDSMITGITAGALDDFANQPTTECNDYPEGGLMKVCTIVNTRGRFGAKIRELSVERAGQLSSRLDPTWLRIINQSPGLAAFLEVPSNVPSIGATLVNELARRMYETSMSFSRMFAPRVWIGTPANNNGQRRDIVGLDIHINENNKRDYRQNALCTAANSVVRNFGFNDVDAAPKYLVEQMEECEYQAVEWNGGRMGLGPIDGFVYMRPEMWRRVSAIWPVQKLFDGLREMAHFTQGRVMVDGMTMFNERNSMRANPAIQLNGRTYGVKLDDTMPQLTPNTNANLSPGQYASDIVFVPMTVMGGLPVTFWQYFRHANANAEALASIVGGGFTFTTDNGMFRWYVNFKNGCINLNFKFNPQLKVKTPMVAWRLTNVKVSPVSHQRSWDPSSAYFADGGVTNTDNLNEQYYSSWGGNTPSNI